MNIAAEAMKKPTSVVPQSNPYSSVGSRSHNGKIAFVAIFANWWKQKRDTTARTPGNKETQRK